MKKDVITCDDNYDILHEYVGGGAYRAIAFGTHNELAKYIKDNNIDMDTNGLTVIIAIKTNVICMVIVILIATVTIT
mgnify:FL=1